MVTHDASLTKTSVNERIEVAPVNQVSFANHAGGAAALASLLVLSLDAFGFIFNGIYTGVTLVLSASLGTERVAAVF